MQCVPIRPKVSFRSALVSLYRITGLLKALPTCGLCLFKGLWSFWIKFQTAVSTFFSLSFFSSLNVMLILVVLLSKRFRRLSETTTMPVSNVSPGHRRFQKESWKGSSVGALPWTVVPTVWNFEILNELNIYISIHVCLLKCSFGLFKSLTSASWECYLFE